MLICKQETNIKNLLRMKTSKDIISATATANATATATMTKSSEKKDNCGECAICMDELNASKNFAKTNCEHSFCLTCLVKALKNNNTCPMCRTNIEDEKPSKTKALNLEDGVDMIKEEMDMFNIQEHVEAITMFDTPGSSLKNTLRLFGLGLVKSIIGFQNEEEGEGFWDDEDDDGDDD